LVFNYLLLTELSSKPIFGSATELAPEPVSGRLHDSVSGRRVCKQCSALESTAAIIAELLRPGESRQIAIEGSPLYLVVKRHRFPPAVIFPFASRQ
jgi:hypothetical protein